MFFPPFAGAQQNTEQLHLCYLCQGGYRYIEDLYTGTRK